MTTAIYSPLIELGLHGFSNATPSRTSSIEFHRHDLPILNQWHQLLNAIRHNASSTQWVTLVNPPFIPNKQYLSKVGLGGYHIRVLRLEETHQHSQHHIEQCLLNGKSGLVALWSNQPSSLPKVITQSDNIECNALVFSSFEPEEKRQMEMSF